MNEPSGGKRGALWGARFSGSMAPEMLPLNLSLDVDYRLWRQDIQGSHAWVDALVGASVITADEGASLHAGLSRVERRLGDLGLDHGPPRDVPDEDIHSLVERLLYEEAGEVAGKLHTGRSRNDQVATDFRLWGREASLLLTEGVEGLCAALLELAERSVDVILPGYTHLQQGQPVRAAHWVLSHFWPLLRDRERLSRASSAASVLPLGSGAIAGCAFPIDRQALGYALGFNDVTENSMDAVSDRDWAVELLFAGALLGTHLSRLGEDLVLFSTREFGFVRLADGHSTGSSLMPQKRNPDVAELVRGQSGRVIGNLVALLTTLKGLPTSYNRDLQDDKRAVFDTVDALAVALGAMAGAVRGLELRPDRIHDALDSQLLATDLADYLVRKGVPFRRSHEVLGQLVRLAEERACSLEDLSNEDFHAAHEAFGPDTRDVFDWERSVDSRAVVGGTARSAVEEQIRKARRRL
jgi:argininosuccinate lyase